MSGAWYRFSAQPPPLMVRVRVQWEGREFIAARARLPNGDDAWAEYRPGSDRPRSRRPQRRTRPVATPELPRLASAVARPGHAGRSGPDDD